MRVRLSRRGFCPSPRSKSELDQVNCGPGIQSVLARIESEAFDTSSTVVGSQSSRLQRFAGLRSQTQTGFFWSPCSKSTSKSAPIGQAILRRSFWHSSPKVGYFCFVQEDAQGTYQELLCRCAGSGTAHWDAPAGTRPQQSETDLSMGNAQHSAVRQSKRRSRVRALGGRRCFVCGLHACTHDLHLPCRPHSRKRLRGPPQCCRHQSHSCSSSSSSTRLRWMMPPHPPAQLRCCHRSP